LLGLGHVLKAVGRYDEAVAAYNECIRHRPESGETYWSLANLKTYRFDDATVAEMQQRLERGGLTVQSEVNFEFALAKGLRGPRRFRAQLEPLPRRQSQAARPRSAMTRCTRRS
jgi:hypothetical protein